jgi:hypothetical protein
MAVGATQFLFLEGSYTDSTYIELMFIHTAGDYMKVKLCRVFIFDDLMLNINNVRF